MPGPRGQVVTPSSIAAWPGSFALDAKGETGARRPPPLAKGTPAARPLDELHAVLSEDWVWNEGRPADIPPFEGTRVVVAGSETVRRNWNIQRTVEAPPADVRLGRELCEPEVRALVRRLEQAVRP
jgi:hypothetical protein